MVQDWLDMIYDSFTAFITLLYNWKVFDFVPVLLLILGVAMICYVVGRMVRT